LAVPLPESGLRLPDGVTVAARNGPRLVTLAGQRALLDEVRQTLADSGVTGRLLRVPHAMHSPAMDVPAAKFAAFMATVPVGRPAIPFISNVTGTWITEEDIRSPEYWGAQMREPVQFERGLANLLSRAGGPLVEVGPGRSMLSLSQGALAQPARGVQTLPSASDGRGDLGMLHEALAALWESGTELSWPAFARQGRRTALPGYSFQRKRYWTDPAADRADHHRADHHRADHHRADHHRADHHRPAGEPGPVPQERDPEGWLYSPAWRSSAGPRVPPGVPRPVVLVGEATEFTLAMADRMTAAGRVVTRAGFGPGAQAGDDLRRALDGAGD